MSSWFPERRTILLLDNDFYKAGYKRCHDELRDYIEFLLTAKAKDLRKYTGK